MKKSKKLWLLFITTLTISATSNGGYAIAANLKEKFVNKYKLINEKEMIDFISLGQTSPGPIAINTSVIVGYKIAGLAGSLIAVLGVILPPLIIMSIITFLYQYIIDNEFVQVFLKGMSCGVCALLLSILIDMFIDVSKEKSIIFYLLIIFSFIFVKFTNISVLILVIISGTVGYIKSKKIIKEVKK